MRALTFQTALRHAKAWLVLRTAAGFVKSHPGPLSPMFHSNTNLNLKLPAREKWCHRSKNKLRSVYEQRGKDDPTSELRHHLILIYRVFMVR